MYLIFGAAGLLIISFAIWSKNERKQDFLFIIGGVFLLIYSIDTDDIIFIILQIVFIASALVEILKLRRKEH